jgi:hypothetical protein
MKERTSRWNAVLVASVSLAVAAVAGTARAQEEEKPAAKPAAAPAAAPKAAPPQWVKFDGKDIVSRPAAIIGADGTFHVFVRRNDEAVWYKKGPLAWQHLGGELRHTVEPAAVFIGQEIAVFSRGKDGALWLTQSSGGKWSPWASMGGNLDSRPFVVSTGEGKIDVFARFKDETLRRRQYDAGKWGEWENLGGVVRSQDIHPIVGKGSIEFFVSRTDGHVWHLKIDRP